MIAYGDGQPAPPILPRESIELQRAASQIAISLRGQLPDQYWLAIVADIAPNLLRLVIHYREPRLGNSGETQTLEINLHSGLPIENPRWLDELSNQICGMISRDESELVIPRPLDYYRHLDAMGNTLYEAGNAFSRLRPNTSEKP